MTAMKTSDYNIGEFTFPRGWFIIGTSAEVTKDKALPIRFFGEDMILYRGASGEVHCLEAYCAHMQTHLCKNTTSYVMRDGNNIEGDSIRCPYHAWRYGPDGVCDDIPYFDGPIPKAAKIKAYTVMEWYGCVVMWNDPEGLPPNFEMPVIPMWDDPQWIKWAPETMGVIDCHPVEVLDNIADYPHVWPTHGSVLDHFRNEFKDHVVVQYQGGMTRPETGLSAGRLDLATWYTGPGFLQSRMIGYYDTHMLIANTPIDEGVTKVWYGIMVKSQNATPAQQDFDAAKMFHETSREAFRQDFEIWANKRPAAQILQIPTDGPFNHSRIWHSQFYNKRSKTQEIWNRTNGIASVRGFAPAVPNAQPVTSAPPFLLLEDA